jgi:hypothetical protein
VFPPTPSDPLTQRCDELEAVIRNRDSAAFPPALFALWQAAEHEPPQALSPVLARCCTLLQQVPLGLGSQLAVLCGALIENGVDPGPFVPLAADGVAECLSRAPRFRSAWETAREDDELPDPEQGEIDSAVQAVRPVLGEDAYTMAEGWYALGSWTMATTTVLQQSAAVRAAFPRKAELIGLSRELEEDRPDLEGLTGLLELLDDETLIVLHRASFRGYQVKINGVGDNFQLHTLLMGALSGPESAGLLGDLDVDPSWIEVATSAPMEAFEGTVVGRFNLVDAYGKWIWNEGKPADIPAFDGVRVVVLDPPPYPRSWSNIRKFPMLTGSLIVERQLPADEASAWLARVAPTARP